MPGPAFEYPTILREQGIKNGSKLTLFAASLIQEPATCAVQILSEGDLSNKLQ